jgi:hypothetical protein
VRAQPHATPACAMLAAECGLGGHQNVCQWYGKRAKRPSPKYWTIIQRVCGISTTAWETWEQLGPIEAAPPPSEKRPKGPRERGSTHEELWRTLDEIDDELEDNELSGTARASLLGRKASTLDRISRLEERQKLEDHPEFDAFAELLHVALERTLKHYGIDPTGARTVFADHLEAAETEQQKRAA